MDKTLPCIICGKELVSVFEGSSVTPHYNQPNDAIVFSSGGNYGSRVYDAFDHSHIEINICDECITEAAERNGVLWVKPKYPPHQYNITHWSTKIE